mmetsp:Transcript_14506/g.29540  ORF Transcript_14506/g.29540 Transcript_14506/m.29540 type:complete len:512 (+) Transcript_14506:50-1585(+)
MLMSESNEIYLAAVEGGGTTFVVSVARVIQKQNHRPSEPDDDDTADRSSREKGKLIQIGPNTLQIIETATIPPSSDLSWSPSRILEETCNFLRHHRPGNSYSAVGIATFGPAGVNPSQVSTFGTILNGSPKKEWRNVDLLTPIVEACGLSPSKDIGDDDCPSSVNGWKFVGFDTDVNAPALAEFRHRKYCMELRQHGESHRGNLATSCNTPSLTSLAYITVGTGVGVGLILNSLPVHGLLHPEGGHVAIRPLENDSFRGYSWGTEKSPYKGVGTVEGMTSSVALTERLAMLMEQENDSVSGVCGSSDEDGDEGNKTRENITTITAQTREILSTLPDTHVLWTHAANAIANLCVSLLLLNSVQSIVLGGGVMKRTVLFDMVREKVHELLNGYLDTVEELSSVEKLKGVIVGGSWSGNDHDGLGSGLAGAFALALDAYEKEKTDENNAIPLKMEQDYRPTPESDEENVKTSSEDRRIWDSERKWFSSGFWVGVVFSLGVSSLVSSVFGRATRR